MAQKKTSCPLKSPDAEAYSAGGASVLSGSSSALVCLLGRPRFGLVVGSSTSIGVSIMNLPIWVWIIFVAIKLNQLIGV